MSIIKWTIAVLVIIGIFGAVFETNYITPDREAVIARNDHGQFLAKNKDEFVDCHKKTSDSTESTLQLAMSFITTGEPTDNFEIGQPMFTGGVKVKNKDEVIENILKQINKECDDTIKEYKQRFEEFENLNEQIAYDSRPIIAKVFGMDISTESYLEIQSTERELNPNARLNMGISREEAEQLILSEIK